MEIRIAETLNDVPLDRLAAWHEYVSGLEDIKDLHNKIEFRLSVVKIFSGMTTYEVAQNKSIVINKAYQHCIDILSKQRVGEPVGEFTIDGQKYVYDKEIHNVSTAQVIDIKLIEDVYKSPYDIMATLYIEEGMGYNEEDKSGKILNPTQYRIDKFKDAPIGEEFLNLMGFFLTDYILLNAAILGQTPRKAKKILKRAAKKTRIVNGTTGQKT